MKICAKCGQLVAEDVNTCPVCGSEVVAGRKAIDDYRILEVLHEGYSSILCKAVREGTDTPVMIRIFTPQSGVDAQVAARLKSELEELQNLPEAYFVRHLEIKQSVDGLWYRISEWVETISWGTLLTSRRLQDSQVALRLFFRIASILEGLHRIGHIIPHLILDDILVYEDEAGSLKVMIDYKLSRFFDPQLDCPGPMLARLLAIHPDIVSQRPLNHLSDIWSLGKVFVEILSSDPEATDPQAKIDTLAVPPEVKTLIRLMLSDAPDLRPRSMAEVAKTLDQVSDTSIQAAGDQSLDMARSPVRVLQRLNVRLSLLLVLLALLIAVGILLWYYLSFKRQDSESALMGYANQYAESVAFVVVDYWLWYDGRRVYHNRSEGTAFLADPEGYLLTNRHVACPWLEDRRLLLAIGTLGQRPGKLKFSYRMLLWFEGQRAFSRLPGLSDEDGTEDIYYTETAFNSHGRRKVRIVGVARAPIKTWELVRSPLRNDFAVLKTEPIPPGLKPLPLDAELNAATIPKLTPVITLGFPLGRQTQTTTVNASVTFGHVRRSFENMFQVDTSIHPGNSGGPFIDTRGRVIGMASTVATVWAQIPIPVATPLSDMGLVLPITKAAAFIQELKAGKLKWNGVLDLELEERLQRIIAEARQRHWEKARSLADSEFASSQAPPLLMANAMMHLCAGDLSGSRRLFNQVLSIDMGNNMARLMILIIDWFAGQAPSSAQRAPLTALDWRSEDEFLGYLARILIGEADHRQALNGGYTPNEISLLHLVSGLFEARDGALTVAQQLLEKAVMTAEFDSWGFLLALAQLDRVQKQHLKLVAEPSVREEIRQQVEAFYRQAARNYRNKREQSTRIASAQAELQRLDGDHAQIRAFLENLWAADKENSDILISLAYYSAMAEDWPAALKYARQFLAKPGRQSAGKLSVGLFEPAILCKLGEKEQARRRLQAFQKGISDSWYRLLSRCLLDPVLQPTFTARAGESPENLLTGHTAIGFWAESQENSSDAIKHYREALGSYIDHRIEYDFAEARLKRLRSEND